MHSDSARVLRVALVLAVGLGGGCGEPSEAPTAGFLADLEQLESFAATTYANLEWAIREGGVDPVAVSAEARAALAEAVGDEEAVAALRAFVGAFGDGHFRLRSPVDAGDRGSGAKAEAPGPETPAEEACPALGYVTGEHSFRLDFGPELRLLTAAGDPLPAGWLERDDGARIGIVRIAAFGADRFGEHCLAVWESFRKRLEGRCADWDCVYPLELEIIERILDDVADRVAELEAAGIDALAIDITGNGGGSDWVDPTARLLTSKALVGNGRSVVRHPHWRGILEEMAAEVDRDLSRELDAEQRAVLSDVRRRLSHGIAQASEPCDLSEIWAAVPEELPCTLLVTDTLYTTGLLSSPPTVDVEGWEIGGGLFKGLEYRSREPAWTGPLAVLIDDDTASASELFATLLRDNDAALLIGQPTLGSGCGYTNGGIQTTLEHSGLVVWLPDCVRQRRDGGNERAGLEPDLAVDWQPGDSPQERGTRLRSKLEAWTL